MGDDASGALGIAIIVALGAPAVLAVIVAVAVILGWE